MDIKYYQMFYMPFPCHIELMIRYRNLSPSFLVFNLFKTVLFGQKFILVYNCSNISLFSLHSYSTGCMPQVVESLPFSPLLA